MAAPCLLPSTSPTGSAFARTGVGMIELRDGKIVRYRDYFDRQTMTEQLGLEWSP